MKINLKNQLKILKVQNVICKTNLICKTWNKKLNVKIYYNV